MINVLFVDDTDLVVMGEKDEDETEVSSRLQQSINFWNGILRVSGGALKPENAIGIFHAFCGQMASGDFQKRYHLQLQSLMTMVELTTSILNNLQKVPKL